MNYIIPSDIDFFKEINEECDENNQNNEICLITQEKLNHNFIKLPCNHTFNYIPIYNELLFQKNNINKRLESSKISLYQIKCPFCRTIHNGLLPYYQNDNIQIINGINSPFRHSLECYKCEHNKRNNIICNKKANCYKIGNYCNYHYKFINNKNNTDVKYCTAILKTGKNKGLECKCKIKDDSHYCKRHTKS